MSGNGQCGYGNDVTGTAMGGGGPFVETSLCKSLHSSGSSIGLHIDLDCMRSGLLLLRVSS